MAEQVGFLGTGNMGVEIAQRLVAAGHDVRVWNRTAARSTGPPATAILNLRGRKENSG